MNLGINIDDRYDKAFHIGSRGYDLIKNRKQQGISYTCSKCSDKYNNEVNMFIGKMSKKHIDKLIKNGFVSYSKKDTSEYTVSLIGNNDVINYISVTSTPQQNDYVDKHYYEDFKKEFGVFPKYIKKDKEYYAKWPEWIKNWKLKLKKYLEDTYNIKDKMTLEEYLSLPYLEDWADIDKYVDINIAKGNKHQYATYIPHIQVNTSKPLVYEKETVIYK